MPPVPKPRNNFKKKPPAPIPIVALSKFHLFPTLPLEVRRMVWSIAIPGQRSIRLIPRRPSKRADQDGGANREAYRLCYGPRGFTDYIPTILLHVCKESRNFALRRYKPFLSSPLEDLPIYFDFEGDTLFFNSNAEWKFMTNLSEEERQAEKEQVLRIAAEMETMLEELSDSGSLDPDSLSNIAESELFTNGSSDEGFEVDNEETDDGAYESDRDSLWGADDSASGSVDHNVADGSEAVGVDLSYLFGDGDSANNDDFAPESDLDSLFGDDASSEEADETFPTPTLHLRGGAGSLFGDDESENAMEVDGKEEKLDWGPLPIRTLAALGMTCESLMGLADPSARMAHLDEQQEEGEDYGSDMDSLFGDGQYANREWGSLYGRNNDGDWDDLGFLYGSSKANAPKATKWKEQLRFIGLGGGACPNHESLTPFTAVAKVTIERRGAFGLTIMMKDHLLQGLKKGEKLKIRLKCLSFSSLTGLYDRVQCVRTAGESR